MKDRVQKSRGCIPLLHTTIGCGNFEKVKGYSRKEKTDRHPDLEGLRSRSQVRGSKKQTGQVRSKVRSKVRVSQKKTGQVRSKVNGSPRLKT